MRRIGGSFLDPIVTGIFTVTGDSEEAIDFDPILQTLAAKSFERWLVIQAEQDPARAHLFPCARMATDYRRRANYI